MTRIHDAVVRVDRAGLIRNVMRGIPWALEARLVEGNLWVHHRSDGLLSHIDPVARTVRAVDVGEVAGIAAGAGVVWVSVDGNRLARLDAATGQVERSFRIAPRKLFELGDAGFVSIVGDSIWLTVPRLGTQKPQSLWRVDAKTGRVREKHRIGVDPTPPLTAGRDLWFVTYDRGLVRFDTESGSYEAIPAGPRPWGYTVGAGSIWVGSELPGHVRRIDPTTGRTTAIVDTEPKVRGLGSGGGFIWVTTETSLQRIDPRTNRVTRTTRITSRVNDEGPTAVVYFRGDVWVSVE